MELMDVSAEILYRYVHHSIAQVIPEPILAQIALATVRALMYLKNELRIIHRYVGVPLGGWTALYKNII